MSSLVEEIVKGRKTFFIAPDKSLFPDSYLEEYLTLGYECYFIQTDLFLPIDKKIDIILSIFKDCIMFFNIDAPLQNDTWANVISKAQKKYPAALFGVIYGKRQSPQEKAQLEVQYLLNIGIQCGCVPLEYQKKNNFGLIEKMLFANQAMGRRKSVRACCSNSCMIKFQNKQGQLVNAKISDISLSHFSISISVLEEVVIEDYEKLVDAQFMIRGLHFRSDAVLFHRRPVDRGDMYIFAFCSKKGTPGLDPMNRQLLVPKIYSVMLDNCQSLLDSLFKSAISHRSKELPPQDE